MLDKIKNLKLNFEQALLNELNRYIIIRSSFYEVKKYVHLETKYIDKESSLNIGGLKIQNKI